MKPCRFLSFLSQCYALALVVLLLSAAGITIAADRAVVIPLIDTVKGVPKTGQTTCYQHEFPHPIIPCAGTGQDGEFQKGIAWPVPRFTDNMNGTVTDNLTDLVWLKNANCLGIKTARDQALNFAEHLHDGYTVPGTKIGDCGLGDGSTAGQWRVPNRFELESLLDLSRYSPALPLGHPFINVQNDYYWTSSFFAWTADLGVGWGVQMGHGMVDPRDWENVEDQCYVWLVRDGS